MAHITLRLLAQHLKLTEGTVSRALNGYPDISEKTRLRVKEAASSMGYRPNQNARRLATGDPECIAYLMPDRSTHASEPFLAGLLSGLSQVCSRRNWDLLVNAPTSPEDALNQLRKWSATRRVSGVVLSRTLAHDPRVDELLKLGIPFITHGRTLNSDNHAWVDTDNQKALEQATRYLLRYGHQRIAYIGGPRSYNFATARLAGFRAVVEKQNLPVTDDMIIETEMSIAAGEKAMQQLLQNQQPPTAVLCVTDTVALGAMKVVRNAGLVAGQDISIIGYDGLDVGTCTTPSLTTMTQPLADAGAMLGDMLYDVIQGASPRSQQRIIEARLLERDSVGAASIHMDPVEDFNPAISMSHSRHLSDSHVAAGVTK